METPRIPNRSHLAPVVLAEALADLGVENACISPGSRSAPLALALAGRRSIRCWSHVDERSGAFFALGLAKTSRRPVVLACTSGTAAANYLPAIVEAWHARVPLLVVTADRPPELRDCGAGQAIDQVKLYGSHVRWFAEISVPDPTEEAVHWLRSVARRAVAESLGPPAGPVHLNLPLREPLAPVDRPRDLGENVRGLASRPSPLVAVATPEVRAPASAVAAAARALAPARRPLVVAGPMDDPSPEIATLVAGLSRSLGAPVLAEPASNLRRSVLADRLVATHEPLLRDDAFAARHRPDAVVRLGGPPTSKSLATWLWQHRDVPQVLVDPAGGFLDPAATAAHVLRSDAARACRDLAASLDEARPRPDHDEWTWSWREAGEQAARALSRSRGEDATPFEAHVVEAIARSLPPDSLLYVGNSLAIRAVDWFWPFDSPPVRVMSNRGTNGIDGFVSSVLGAAASHPGRVVSLCGDLSFLHDLNGLLAARRHGLRATFVVVNNDGGGIFDFLPIAQHRDRYEELFVTPHGLDLGVLARGFGVGWQRVLDPSGIPGAIRRSFEEPGASVVEVVVDRSESVVRHRRGWEAVSEELGAGR